MWKYYTIQSSEEQLIIKVKNFHENLVERIARFRSDPPDLVGKVLRDHFEHEKCLKINIILLQQY